MFLRADKARYRTAAWRISFGGVLVFAIGSAIAFLFLQQFLIRDLQHRADSWLVGELGVLSEVAERTPDDKLHDIVIQEVAELASREAPGGMESQPLDQTVFFLMTTNGRPTLHTGAGAPTDDTLRDLRTSLQGGELGNVKLPGTALPFRVAFTRLPSGQGLYLGLSSHYERQVLHRLRVQFVALWLIIIGLGGSVLFLTTRRMLQRVQSVSDTASSINNNNLAARVPVSARRDEISQMSSTFNQMLDRIQSTIQHVHTMSDSIAHDLRSPLTALRGKLESALTEADEEARMEALACAVEDVDRLSSLLSVSLDISEANANALRLRKSPLDLTELTSRLCNLYSPLFADAGLSLDWEVPPSAVVVADSALMERVLMNLFENALNHLSPGSNTHITVRCGANAVSLIFADNGGGFPQELLPRALEPFARGYTSTGSGLGLAFVAAVVRTHEGTVHVTNGENGGATVAIKLPLCGQMTLEKDHVTAPNRGQLAA